MKERFERLACAAENNPRFKVRRWDVMEKGVRYHGFHITLDGWDVLTWENATNSGGMNSKVEESEKILGLTN